MDAAGASLQSILILLAAAVLAVVGCRFLSLPPIIGNLASLALGAFLAGMLISETEYRYQVEAEIKPFRDVLLGLFFVTVGMMLDLRLVFDRIGLVLALLVLLVAFNFALIGALAAVEIRLPQG
jgi:Kef-type K+ transport system membrane component KefB